MREENNSKPETELWEALIFDGWAKRVDHTEAYNRNVRNCEASGFTQLAS